MPYRTTNFPPKPEVKLWSRRRGVDLAVSLGPIGVTSLALYLASFSLQGYLLNLAVWVPMFLVGSFFEERQIALSDWRNQLAGVPKGHGSRRTCTCSGGPG